MDGILLVDKPPGLTSFQVVDRLKRTFRISKIGHGGSLDPLATGLLVVLLGRATKSAARLLDGEKEYEAEACLGLETDTQDVTGRVRQTGDASKLTREAVAFALRSFQGEIEQLPPMVSALKHQGERLYRLARRGLEVPRATRKVEIKEITMLAFSSPRLRFLVRCSKGTYVRTLCHDLGRRLGVGGCLSSLRRTSSGPFRLEQAHPLDRLLSGSIRDLQDKIVQLT